ncbi:uracil-DNA glycosylase [Notoacmeibacter sp. MSK16QG-6]|uniref:uracil-DNA glycosylase n=1 Tax=Notoacmeibacter sp. MSK16QG-6 TaxID=2957982 RepID=UPI0020A06645|nr:uracil-DNA glycosylase [Notoacmeibacter sp. MSK16QG-6]MCP1198104.1 uracil-DNA glycosylase [Notoacmeibacter sp. MSK16QG-6]
MNDLAGILEFYRDAGVDTPLDDHPVNRLALPEPAALESSAAKVGRPPEQRPGSSATPFEQRDLSSHSLNGDNLPALIAEATEIARQADSIETLQEALIRWNGIDLANTIPTMVFGSGPARSELFILADCPERQDVSGEQLWSGPGGRMVDMMLAAIGRSRSDTRIAASCPWRPPGDIPTEEQQSLLRPFLLRQIALCQPEVVLTFGQTALKSVTGQQSNFLKERGRWHNLDLPSNDGAIGSTAIRPTFHPHYLMKNPAQKRLTWSDLLAVKARLAENS